MLISANVGLIFNVRGWLMNSHIYEGILQYCKAKIHAKSLNEIINRITWNFIQSKYT